MVLLGSKASLGVRQNPAYKSAPKAIPKELHEEGASQQNPRVPGEPRADPMPLSPSAHQTAAIPGALLYAKENPEGCL